MNKTRRNLFLLGSCHLFCKTTEIHRAGWLVGSWNFYRSVSQSTNSNRNQNSEFQLFNVHGHSHSYPFPPHTLSQVPSFPPFPSRRHVATGQARSESTLTLPVIIQRRRRHPPRGVRGRRHRQPRVPCSGHCGGAQNGKPHVRVSVHREPQQHGKRRNNLRRLQLRLCPFPHPLSPLHLLPLPLLEVSDPMLSPPPRLQPPPRRRHRWLCLFPRLPRR